MAKPYTINIVDGVGQSNILSGNYTIVSTTNGYDNTSILPSTLTVDKVTSTYTFTIASTGTLNIHVSDTGTDTGNPVERAKFIRCDKNGVEYGTEIISNSTGIATFTNVPYSETNAPLIYYKQIESDGEHEFDNTLKNTSLNANTKTIEVLNSSPLQRTINFTDANYDGLPIETGEILFE